ncbi:universal stress protein [Streptomyces sp. NPDC058240]|uniref:universal stress protein n=1 Tax=Streptomyces sp. NPDC058240 TaxID=3346396 RepID=UPI0036EB34E2
MKGTGIARTDPSGLQPVDGRDLPDLTAEPRMGSTSTCFPPLSASCTVWASRISRQQPVQPTPSVPPPRSSSCGRFNRITEGSKAPHPGRTGPRPSCSDATVGTGVLIPVGGWKSVRMMKSPLVLGVDGSETTLRAVDWAADEAVLHGLPLRLVYASRCVVRGRRARTQLWAVSSEQASSAASSNPPLSGPVVVRMSRFQLR